MQSHSIANSLQHIQQQQTVRQSAHSHLNFFGQITFAQNRMNSANLELPITFCFRLLQVDTYIKPQVKCLQASTTKTSSTPSHAHHHLYRQHLAMHRPYSLQQYTVSWDRKKRKERKRYISLKPLELEFYDLTWKH